MDNEARREQLSAFNEDMQFMDGHDDCLLGVASRFGMEDVACYDYDKLIASLVADGMTEEEAVEWHEFNQLGAWVGEQTPVFVRVIPPEETGSDTPAPALSIVPPPSPAPADAPASGTTP